MRLLDVPVRRRRGAGEAEEVHNEQSHTPLPLHTTRATVSTLRVPSRLATTTVEPATSERVLRTPQLPSFSFVYVAVALSMHTIYVARTLTSSMKLK